MKASSVMVIMALFSLQADAKLSQGLAGKVQLAVNPIRRVVTMLQSMQKKVAEEGEKEQVLFDKFMCYCKNGKGALESSIEQAKQTNDQLKSSIEETDATLKQTKADLKAAQESRAEAKEADATLKQMK